MRKTEEPALLVLRRTQRTTVQIVNAAKGYAHVKWRFDTTLRETLAGANYLKEPTVQHSGARQALLAPTECKSVAREQVARLSHDISASTIRSTTNTV